MSAEGAGVPVLRNPFSNIPRLTTYIAAGLGVAYLLSLIPGSAHFLALVPENTFGKFYVWNLVTSGYYQNSLISAIVSIIGVLLVGKYLEPVWGSREFLKFIIIVNICTSVTIFFGCIGIYIFGFNEDILFRPICSFLGVLSAFSVTIKQLVPNHEVSFFFAFTIKARHVPVLFILVSGLFWLLGAPAYDFAYALFGALYGWIYLRFFQDKSDGTKGDISATFNFASFFPDALTPVCAPIGAVFYLVCCRWWRPAQAGSALPTYQFTGRVPPPSTLPGSTPQDAERRRQKAIQALNMRLGDLAKQPEVPLSVDVKAPDAAPEPAEPEVPGP